MRKIIVECGCSIKMETICVDNGKKGEQIEYLAGICEICDKNGGDFTKSPRWKDKTAEKLEQAKNIEINNRKHEKEKNSLDDRKVLEEAVKGFRDDQNHRKKKGKKKKGYKGGVPCPSAM